MRVLFVEPSTYPSCGSSNGNGSVEREISTKQIRLCLPLLAALMPPEDDIVVAFDMFEDVSTVHDLASFDLVGVTCTGHSGQIARAMELGRKLRDAGVPSILGGPVTVQDEHYFVPILARFFDSIVVGEAEPVLPNLLQDVRDGTLQPVYRGGEFARFVDVPVPRFELADLERFDAPHVYPVQTARGCPRACTFCSEPLYGPWRYRPIDEVVSELEAYRTRYGAKHLVFRDDDFLIHPRRSRELLPRMAELGLEWACQTDLNLTRHMDVAELAVDAGLHAICFGLESIDEENRKDVGKTFFTLEAVPELLAMFNERGVEVQMNIIFGLDHDTPEIFDETVDFMLRNRVTYWYANILSPEAGTALHERMKQEGRLVEIPPFRLDDPELADEAGFPTIRRSFLEAEDPAFINFVPKHLTAEQLVELTMRARKRFLAERQPTFWLAEKSEY